MIGRWPSSASPGRVRHASVSMQAWVSARGRLVSSSTVVGQAGPRRRVAASSLVWACRSATSCDCAMMRAVVPRRAVVRGSFGGVDSQRWRTSGRRCGRCDSVDDRHCGRQPPHRPGVGGPSTGYGQQRNTAAGVIAMGLPGRDATQRSGVTGGDPDYWVPNNAWTLVQQHVVYGCWIAKPLNSTAPRHCTRPPCSGA